MARAEARARRPAPDQGFEMKRRTMVQSVPVKEGLLMPELQRCVYCDKAMDPEKDKWVTVEFAAEEFGRPIVPQMAHAECHNMSTPLERT
jgi:hypothetical protein